jgi:hypothetical protein
LSRRPAIVVPSLDGGPAGDRHHLAGRIGRDRSIRRSWPDNLSQVRCDARSSETDAGTGAGALLSNTLRPRALAHLLHRSASRNAPFMFALE